MIRNSLFVAAALALGPGFAVHAQETPTTTAPAPTAGATATQETLVLPPPAPGATTLTLLDAFRRAIVANGQVAVAKSEIDAAEARKANAKSFLFPRVTFSGNVAANSESATFGTGENERTILPSSDWTTQIGFRQPLFAGLRDFRTFAQAKLKIAKAGSHLSDVENLVLLQTGADYLTVVEAEALLAVEQKNLELAKRRLKQSTDFFEVGEVTRVDVLRAETGIKAAEREIATAQGVRDKALGSLRIDLAWDGGEIAVVPPGDFLPPLPDAPALTEAALASSPELAQAEMQVKIAELEVKKQKGARLPIAYLEGAYIKQKRDFPTDQYGTVALKFEVPLFEAGEISANVREAESDLRADEARRDDIKRALAENVRTAVSDVVTAQKVLELAQQEQAAAEREYSETFELYQAQEVASLDLQSAETALAESRRRRASAAIRAQIAEVQAWYLTGRLRLQMVPTELTAPELTAQGGEP